MSSRWFLSGCCIASLLPAAEPAPAVQPAPAPPAVQERISVGADGSRERVLLAPLDDATATAWKTRLLSDFDRNGNGRLDQSDWLRARTATRALAEGLASPLIGAELRALWVQHDHRAGLSAGIASQVLDRLHSDARQAVTAALGVADQDGDGTVSPAEQEQRSLRQAAVLLETDAAALVKELDTDADGRLTAEAERRALGERVQAWQRDLAALREHDADRDGQLSTDERAKAEAARAAIAEQARKSRDDELRQLYRQADSDANGALSEEEFLNAWPRLLMHARMPARTRSPERPAAPGSEGGHP